MDIIKKIADNKKKKYNEISKLLNLKKNYTFKFVEDKNNKMMLHILDNNKKILTSSFNLFGIYQINTKIWQWSSSIPGTSQKHIKTINKIRSSSYLFESNNNPKIMFYYQFLTQDMIYISNLNLLNWINELLIYLSNDLYIFNPIEKNENNILNQPFITIKKIKELYI